MCVCFEPWTSGPRIERFAVRPHRLGMFIKLKSSLFVEVIIRPLSYGTNMILVKVHQTRAAESQCASWGWGEVRASGLKKRTGLGAEEMGTGLRRNTWPEERNWERGWGEVWGPRLRRDTEHGLRRGTGLRLKRCPGPGLERDTGPWAEERYGARGWGEVWGPGLRRGTGPGTEVKYGARGWSEIRGPELRRSYGARGRGKFRGLGLDRYWIRNWGEVGTLGLRDTRPIAEKIFWARSCGEARGPMLRRVMGPGAEEKYGVRGWGEALSAASTTLRPHR